MSDVFQKKHRRVFLKENKENPLVCMSGFQPFAMRATYFSLYASIQIKINASIQIKISDSHLCGFLEPFEFFDVFGIKIKKLSIVNCQLSIKIRIFASDNR